MSVSLNFSEEFVDPSGRPPAVVLCYASLGLGMPPPSVLDLLDHPDWNLVHNLDRFAFLSKKHRDNLKSGAAPDRRRMGRKMTRASAPPPPPTPPPSPSTTPPLVTISAEQHSALLAALQDGCRTYLRGVTNS